MNELRRFLMNVRTYIRWFPRVTWKQIQEFNKLDRLVDAGARILDSETVKRVRSRWN